MFDLNQRLYEHRIQEIERQSDRRYAVNEVLRKEGKGPYAPLPTMGGLLYSLVRNAARLFHVNNVEHTKRNPTITTEVKRVGA